MTETSIAFQKEIPILRSFSEEKAKEFYRDYLGFTVDWEHRFEPGTPLYMQVSRGTLTFHLSEHHGDAVPGAGIYVEMTGLRALLEELQVKGYKYQRPEMQETDWGTYIVTLTDPFGNRIRLNEKKQQPE